MLYLFDIDGTLVLSGGAGSKALNVVFRERYGLERAMDSVRPDGKTDPLIVTEVFATCLGREPHAGEVDAVIAAYVPHLFAAVSASTNFRILPAVLETLDFLDAQEDAAIGVATGNVREGARAKLERPDLWRRFAIGGFGDDAADRGELVAHAIDRGRAHFGVAYAPDDVVVVGDTARDVIAAHACGAIAVAVATGSTARDELEAAGADAVFDTLAELPAWHHAVTAQRRS